MMKLALVQEQNCRSIPVRMQLSLVFTSTDVVSIALVVTADDGHSEVNTHGLTQGSAQSL